MTPGTLSIPIYRGAKWEHTLLLKDSSTGLPLDLTGLGPFVFQIKPLQGNYETVPVVTVTSSYDATGLITISLTAAETLLITPMNIRAGMRDNFNNPYIECVLPVFDFTPDPI
jgi:hypothetical protein